MKPVLLNVFEATLPLQDPVLKFLVLLIIILFAPLLLNKIKIPHLLGLIIAGAVIGPNGFNVLPRDSNIVVTGTTGLLYIMFLAGLEIDLADFKKNKWKSLAFGMYTFTIPLVFGIISGYYILGFSWLTSILFASLFSSHTLISYPLVSKLGVAKNRAVNITVGGTMITDILALLVLAVVVGFTKGEVTNAFWIQLGVSVVLFGAIVLIVFPIIGRWFFKQVDDKISHYIFVLVMIYLAALLAEIAGIEAIIGAFLAGLALNRLIPHTSSLMNRVEFIGNAFFIPFFLIGVGMLIDFKAFFKDWNTIKVAAIMSIVAIGTKYLAAVATQKTFRFTNEEGKLIFGLSTASAAATLAAVMVGYNIILTETESGAPVRLLDESVLNGSILMILISCTVSSFVSMNNANKIAQAESENTVAEDNPDDEKILLAVNHATTVEPMTNLSVLLKSKKNTEQVYALNIINEEKNDSSKKNAEKILDAAVNLAAAADVTVTPLIRYDSDVINGVNNVIKLHTITDLVIGIEREKGFTRSFVYNLYDGYLNNKTTNVLVYHSAQPIATIQRHLVVMPGNAHMEPGFFHSLLKIWNIARNSGAVVVFYAPESTLAVIRKIHKKVNIEAEFVLFVNWAAFTEITDKMKDNDSLIILMAKRGMVSYLNQMQEIPNYLNKHFTDRNYLLIYPYKSSDDQYQQLKMIDNVDEFLEIGNIIGRIFK